MQESNSGQSGDLNLPVVLEDRKEYEGNMEKKLADLGCKIDEMACKAEDLKDKASVKLEELKKKREEASCKFDELKKQGKEAWKDFKAHLDTAMEDLSHAVGEMKEGCSDAKSKFEKN